MNNDIYTKKMPASIEAEQSVLGSVLIDPSRIGDVTQLLSVEDFYVSDHKEIFTAMHKLFAESKTIDPVILADNLSASGVYDLEQSKGYVRTLAEIVPSAANVLDYANIVKEKSLMRKLIETCDEISDDAYAGNDSATAIIDSAESRIYALSAGKEQRGFVHIRDVLVNTYKHIHEVAQNREEAMGIATGFSGLDKVLVGMGKSDLILVGARPGMGKTSFALNIATNVAAHTKKAVCIFSLEMSNEQLVQRMLSSEALVESGALRSGILSKEDWDKLAKASTYLAETDIYIDDSTGITATAMKGKLRRVKNLGLVVIDYLQLMQSDKKTDNRVQEVSDISRNLKLLAKELQVPVICCAQLSRGAEQRGGDSHPMLSDLRDSGAIEQDADVIMFISRDYYQDKPENENTADIIVAKNRHGGTGKVSVGWFGKYTKFTTIEDREEN